MYLSHNVPEYQLIMRLVEVKLKNMIIGRYYLNQEIAVMRNNALLTGMGLSVALMLPYTAYCQTDSQDQRRTPVVDVFESCHEAVVNISATQFIERGGMFELDDIFEHLFDRRRGSGADPRRRLRQTSVGSGFILHEDGYIVTNAHVVARTAERKVVFSDGEEYEAHIVAIDVERDLAVLKIDAKRTLETLKLGTSDDLMIGETVIAIGNPFGYQHTVTSGVVSALDRTLDIHSSLKFEGLIQTDASINPGNSGGPLLNILGELIGVNSAIRADAQNIGFAIPVDQLREQLPAMLSIERRYRVDTGLELVYGDEKGLIVEDVEEGSAAALAGLRKGDAIEAVAESETGDLVEFHIALLGSKPGDEVEMKVRRSNTILLATMKLKERPVADGIDLAERLLGLTIVEIGQEELRKIGFSDKSMLRVVAIERNSPADQIDIRRDDLLIEINGQFPASADELGVLLENIESGDKISISYMRGTARSRAQWRTSIRAR